MSKYVFDSYALVAHFQDEPGGARVEALMRAPLHERWIVSINAGEVYYIAARRLGLGRAKEVLNDLLSLPIQIVEPNFALVIEAAAIKAQHALSYADCFAAALAQRYGATIVTGDEEFEAVEHLVQIEWLPPKPKRRR